MARITHLFYPDADVQADRVIVRASTTPAQFIQVLQSPELVPEEEGVGAGAGVSDKMIRYAKLYNLLYRGDCNLSEAQDDAAKAEHAAAEALRIAMQLPADVANKLLLEQKRSARALARSNTKLDRFSDRERAQQLLLTRTQQLERKKPQDDATPCQDCRPSQESTCSDASAGKG